MQELENLEIEKKWKWRWKKMLDCDRTGLAGYGSRTIRGLGYFSEYDSPGLTKGAPRCGGGFGRGSFPWLGKWIWFRPSWKMYVP